MHTCSVRCEQSVCDFIECLVLRGGRVKINAFQKSISESYFFCMQCHKLLQHIFSKQNDPKGQFRHKVTKLTNIHDNLCESKSIPYDVYELKLFHTMFS